MIGPASRPSYGIDGPNALAGLGATAAVSGATAVLLRRGAAAMVAGAAAGVSTGLIATMLAYSLRGKVALRDLLLAEVEWRGDETVLDVGTGAGLMAIGAAERTRGPVLGVDVWTSRDLTRNGPERAMANAAATGVRVGLARADAQRLPVGNATVDVVTSVFCLHNLPDPAAATREIVRVLRPGGTVLIADLAGTAAHARAFTAAGLAVRTWRAPLLTVLGPAAVVVARG